MISTSTDVQRILSTNTTKTEDVVRNIYPQVSSDFFNEPPNIYDKKYISGVNRGEAMFKEEFINEKARHLDYIRTMCAPCPENFQPISRDEANTSEGSWLTVISGKRSMGEFSVDSLYDPVLHALSELPFINCKIFPKENNAFLYIVIIYRNDTPQGELRADRYIELYREKREIMQNLTGATPELKAVKSELVIAREMGELFGYKREEIDNYMKQISDRLEQIMMRQSAPVFHTNR